MKKLLLYPCFIFCAAQAHAQYYTIQKWEAQPKVHEVPEAFKVESAVFVLDSRRIEYRRSDGETWVYRTVHRIVKVLDEKGIESFNKISISFLSEEDKKSIAARTILPDGSIKEVTRDKIKLTKDEDGSPAYVFAMEGVEKNAEIEYQYTERMSFAVFGSEIHQFSLPVMHADLTLSAPSNLHFELKGYNDMPAAEDTLMGNTHYYHTEASNIPPLTDEPYSDLRKNLMRTEYRISFVDGENAQVRLFTWNELAKKLYENNYGFTDKEKKIVRKYLSSIKVNESDNAETKVRKIEDALKSGINMSEDITDESYLSFDNIVEKKLTTEKGFIRFFVACLSETGVEHELGITSNRFQYPLDEDFENWRHLDLYVLYFPRLDKYLSPSGIFYRMPFVPPAITGNKVIFCKQTRLGDIVSARASIRVVPLQPITVTSNDIRADIRFDDEMVPVIEYLHSFRGYSANGVREAFVYTTKEKEKEIVQDLVMVATTPEDIKTYKVENVPFENYYENKPLLVRATVKAPQLVEKAGNKYLFKVGDVIGRQVEMYQEKERKLPIDLAYPHTQERILAVEIPQGYKVTNPEALNMNVQQKTATSDSASGFTSSYKLEGNKLLVNIMEFYAEIHQPKSEIEDFKKVINAAADFNKIVLVLEKS